MATSYQSFEAFHISIDSNSTGFMSEYNTGSAL